MKGLTWVGILIGLIALAFLINPDITRAQNYNSRGCAWPIEMSPEGTTNVQAPDAAARYWVMPFDTTQYQTMTIKGTYPNIRYFSIAAYNTLDGDFDLDAHGHLYDAQIVPDQGSINPFVKPGGDNDTYTVVISHTTDDTPPSEGNTITVSSDLAWVILRMYVADNDLSQSGRSLMGGVPLPIITVTDKNGNSKKLETCSPVNKWEDVSSFDTFLFPPSLCLSVDEGEPDSNRLWFASPQKPPGILWPNPDGKYLMMMPGNEYQPGRIIVIHGKAPGFPDTFNGSPIWVPSRGFRNVDLRYWALCNVNFAMPLSVVDCATDLTTRLERGQNYIPWIDWPGRFRKDDYYYTIVISDDRQRPNWLKPNINWLPWGDEQYPKLVVLRNMLPATDFFCAVQDAWEAGCTFNFKLDSIPDTNQLEQPGECAQRVMGDYYPVAVWCDKSTFIHGGWRACLNEW